MSSRHLIVMKFGGTSVGNAERFRQCAKIISQAAKQDRIVVVASAMAGVTDLIFRTIETARHGDAAATAAHLGRFEAVHRELIASLFDANYSRAAEVFTAEIFAQLRSACHALSALRSDISAQTADSLVAIGERISAWVLARYLQQSGSAAEFVRAEDVILTDSNFGNAMPDMEATRANCGRVLAPLLKGDVIPIVAGYSGANAQGKTTTLGRGGSDYSATILGAATGADEVWIWTDVDGVLTADPRTCPDATTLPEISFAEAIELAYYGAKVIHPKAAYPAADAGFPVWIKNSFRPEVAGTKITHAAGPGTSPVKSVTAVKNATLITLVTRRDVHPVELWGRLFLRLGQEQIEVLFATQSSPEHTLGLVLRKDDAVRVLKLINAIFRIELGQGVLLPAEINDEIAVIAVLGESMRGKCGILGRVFSAVARCDVSVIAVAQGASELSICFAVPARHGAEVVHSVHDEFCGQSSASMPVCLRPNFAAVTEAQ
ncbi:MAG TPA: aspartate kinase [Candidatus Sulfotelmatobacter sp.]|nr:aspartate kinase [Candidatus Sulfotelmatobacter sp.]